MTKSTKLTPRFRFAPLQALGRERVRLTPDPIESYDKRAGYDPGFIGRPGSRSRPSRLHQDFLGATRIPASSITFL